MEKKPLVQNIRPQQDNMVLDPPLSGVEDRETTTKEKKISNTIRKTKKGGILVASESLEY